jgi:hypothetical protein
MSAARLSTVLGAALATVALTATAALAQWTTTGSGTGSATSTTINPPTTANAAGASSTTVTVSVTAGPSGGAPVHGYRVDRTSPSAASGVCFITGTTGSCTATASGTGEQTYSIVSYRGTTSLQYWQSAALSNVKGTPLTSLTISSVVRDGGNKKVHFTGTGAVSGTALTVQICTVNAFPCAAGNQAGTSSVTPSAAGAWTSGQSTANLNASQTYYAQATQGSSTSAVFTFSTTNL